MRTIQSQIVRLITVLIFTISSLSVVSAQEIKTENFSGTINTTLSSGFTMRASERDCSVSFGYQYTSAVTSDVYGNPWGSVASQNGQGCSGYRTDAYGNTSTEYINIAGSNPNSDDGNLNFNNGDIVNATQKFYTEIIGNTNGVGINFSLIGSLNPVNDINAPIFKTLKSDALAEQEQNITLLNAYITTEFDTGNNFIDATIGRSVVSWGEATFIPVTANGLVTGALDLSKLRAPGSSIKEALMPVEQIVLSTNVDGIGFEGYYQFQSDMVQLDVAGSFFGSEIVGMGETGLIAAGSFQNERKGDACPYQLTYDLGVNCTDAINAQAKSGLYDADTYIDFGFDNSGLSTASQTAVGIGRVIAATKTFGSTSLAQNLYAAGSTGVASDRTYGDLTTLTTAGDAFYQNASTAGFIEAMTLAGSHRARPTDRIAGVQINVADDGKFKHARSDGQYGIKLSSYIDTAGGIDLSFYYSNYHSKVPYLRVKGQKGLFAGDLYGLFTAAIYDQQDNNFSSLAAFRGGNAYDESFTGNAFGRNIINGVRAISYSGAICNAALGKAMAATVSAGSTGTKYTTTAQERAAWANVYMSTALTGEANKQHDPNKCGTFATAANATTDARHATYGVAVLGSASATSKTGGASDAHLKLLGTGAMIAAAITPMNYFEYDFIFPEDNQIFGTSFSTVVDGTVVQGELSFRPSFPLATPGGSQVAQLTDASGSTQMLNWVAFNGLNGAGQTIASVGDTTGDGVQLKLGLQVLGATGAYASSLNNNNGDTAVYTKKLRDFKRSSLAAISTATVMAGDYYSTPFLEYDVWSADIGTTSAFNASHPITVGLGADSVVFLTELAMVHIANLDNANGYVARGGSSESGDSSEKCNGAFGTTNVYTATKGVDALGASTVDGLFGNGGYCEDNPGAGETSLSYRLIGAATYNNFANSQWSVRPNFAWSHDPSGYGPSSLGGFVEGRMSLALGLGATKGAVSASLSYVNQLGDAESNLSRDKDTLSASVSYAF